MAIAKGKESKGTLSFPKYVGICPVSVIAVCPDKAEREKIYNTTFETAPVYAETMVDDIDQSYRRVRIDFLLKPEVENIPANTIIPMSLYVESRYAYNKDRSKVQVIDKYGRTGWVTIEMAKTHSIPLDRNGNPLNIDADYRPAYRGEEDFTKFIKTYLCIDDVHTFDNVSHKWVPNTRVNPVECECRLDNFSDLFKGDLSSIKDIIGFQPNNKLKVLLGVRVNADNGQLYQAVYTREFLRNNASNYKKFFDAIVDMTARAAAQGKPMSTIYKAMPVEEYKVTPTEITPSAAPQPSINDPLGSSLENINDLPW